jgi:diguanylate cyclase (GGDEF)-like protein
MAPKPFGLTLKFNLFIASLVLATALSISLFLTLWQLSDRYDSLLRHGNTLALMAAQNGEYAVYTRSGEALTQQLHYLKGEPDLVYAVYMDRDARTLAATVYREGVRVPPLEAAETPQSFWHSLLDRHMPQAIEVSTPVMSAPGGMENAVFLDLDGNKTEVLGQVRIGLALDSFRREVVGSMRLALWVSCLILAVATLVAMLMTRRIIAPLRRLAAAAHGVADGYLAPVAIESGSAEIHELAEAFNTMTERLRVVRSDVESYQQLLERMVYMDDLTGLANRVLLKDHIKLALGQASRDDSAVALLFLDLDRFKHVNDSLGHSLGDQLLKDVAERLRMCMRAGDTVARMGGDEFVVVLNSLPNAEAEALAGKIAEKIAAALTPPFQLQSHEITATFSIGIAFYPRDATDAEELIKYADAAMYEAKAHGRNTYQYYRREMTHGGLRRLTLETALRRAIEREEFELYLQPQFCLNSARVVGAEALLRWIPESGDPISPGEFIPLAEETGLILPLGEWVIGTATRIKADWISRELCCNGFRSIAVNVSPQQFWSQDFAQRVLRIIEDASANLADSLELELTESCLMHHSVDILRNFGTLREAGIRFSIDDFGTGYSSLSYLRQFPLDVLKIDQSFVRGCTEDASNAAIIRAIIAMAAGLGLEVIAEGVETRDQADFLAGHGCRLFQGYYFGRPTPVRQFEQQFLKAVPAEI